MLSIDAVRSRFPVGLSANSTNHSLALAVDFEVPKLKKIQLKRDR